MKQTLIIIYSVFFFLCTALPAVAQQRFIRQAGKKAFTSGTKTTPQGFLKKYPGVATTQELSLIESNLIKMIKEKHQVSLIGMRSVANLLDVAGQSAHGEKVQDKILKRVDRLVQDKPEIEKAYAELTGEVRPQKDRNFRVIHIADSNFMLQRKFSLENIHVFINDYLTLQNKFMLPKIAEIEKKLTAHLFNRVRLVADEHGSVFINFEPSSHLNNIAETYQQILGITTQNPGWFDLRGARIIIYSPDKKMRISVGESEMEGVNPDIYLGVYVDLPYMTPYGRQVEEVVANYAIGLRGLNNLDEAGTLRKQPLNIKRSDAQKEKALELYTVNRYKAFAVEPLMQLQEKGLVNKF